MGAEASAPVSCPGIYWEPEPCGAKLLATAPLSSGNRDEEGLSDGSPALQRAPPTSANRLLSQKSDVPRKDY